MSPAPGRQEGAALLVMMLVVLVAASAILVSRLNAMNLSSARAKESTAALAVAREALLAYAATEPDRVPGAPVRLPCPDLDAGGGLIDGEAHAAQCGAESENVLGRLPWRTLGMQVPKDSAAACLWYAVSGDYKAADTSSARMLNPDSAGQFRVYDATTGALLDGATAADRPVAVVFAPGAPLAGQGRNAADTTECSATFDPARFLDDASGIGIDNAALLGGADTIDDFAVAARASETHNDRVAVIRQSDLAAIANSRHDYLAEAEDLGLAVAACIADYGRNNSASDDLRLPWPAPLALGDYRSDASYNDADLGVLAGRLPDAVGDSAAATSNSMSLALTNCSVAAVPGWTATMQARWRNLKDHFFYVVADSYAPPSSVPTACTDCLTVNGGGQYAAVLLYAGPALQAQVRTMPPNDADTRSTVSNYLEGANAAAFPFAGGPLDLASGAATTSFNDMLFCIAPDLTVTSC